MEQTSELPDPEEHHERKEATVNMGYYQEGQGEEKQWKEQAWDDLTGVELDPQNVKEARAKELVYVKKKPVWVKVPRKVAIERGW